MSAQAVVESEVLRSTRHLEARSAQELKAWLQWLELGGFSSCDAYERTCADLLNAFPHKEMGDFTDADVMQVLMAYPVRSRRVRKAHLSSWFKWGVRTDRIASNPIDKLPTIKRHKQPVLDIFTEAEQARLEALPLPDGPLMALMLEAGLRRSEACHMRVARLDFDKSMVIVKEGAKGGKDRMVPMVPGLRAALSELVMLEGLNDSDFLWYDKPGGGFAKRVRRSQPLAPTSFGRWWYRCLDDANVPYLKRDPKAGIEGRGNPHTARHTFATRWRSRGLELDDLAQTLGHASIATTSDLYVHTSAHDISARMHELLGAEG